MSAKEKEAAAKQKSRFIGKDRDWQMSAKEKEAAANRHRRFYRLFYE